MKDFFSQRLLPAVTLYDTDSALRLAQTFRDYGLNVMEVTFRTNQAATFIRDIRNTFPEIHVGAGTLLSPEQVEAAVDAGAQFGLSPGLNTEVTQAALAHKFPFIPGVSTSSEIEKALQLGFNILKLFPIKTLGEVAFIKSLEGPYGHLDIQFIPMGGVDINNLSSYLQHDTVLACGGSWLAPTHLLKEKDFSGIGRIVRKSLARRVDL